MGTHTGDRFIVWELSPDYGERRFAIDDAALTRDSLVRHWRQRGKGAVTAHGIRPPKTGLIWRGTKEEAAQLCQALNKAAKLGTLTIATDPPIRENAIANAKIVNAQSSTRKRAARSRSTANLFTKCSVCQRMVKDNHQCTST